jgi:hypothetical protein
MKCNKWQNLATTRKKVRENNTLSDWAGGSYMKDSLDSNENINFPLCVIEHKASKNQFYSSMYFAFRGLTGSLGSLARYLSGMAALKPAAILCTVAYRRYPEIRLDSLPL